MAKIVFEEDAEIVIPESTKKVVDDADIFDESSDDEAPEAISTSTAKESSMSKAKAEKEALAKAAAEEKEKRRQKDQLLKEQKKGSRKQQKELKKKKEEVEEEEEEELNLLPQELLEQALVEEEQDKKRKHLTEEDFERMIAEQEAEEKAKAKKRKTVNAGRQVGEYTVKVLNQRPKLQKADKNILNMRKMHLQRKSVPRKEAVINISSGRDGAALVFKRSK